MIYIGYITVTQYKLQFSVSYYTLIILHFSNKRVIHYFLEKCTKTCPKWWFFKGPKAIKVVKVEFQNLKEKWKMSRI